MRSAILPASITFICLLLAITALKQIDLSREAADVVYLGQRLNLSNSIDSAAVETRMEDVFRLAQAGVCRSDVVISSATVVLADVDFKNPDDDYEEWANAVISARDYLLHALTCIPTRGDLWLRLAMIQNAAGENPSEVVSLLSQSQLMAPSEGDVVFGRLRFWSRLSDTTLDLGTSVLEKDIMTACIDPTRLKNLRVSASLAARFKNVAPARCRSMVLS